MTTQTITLDQIRELAAENGYEIVEANDDNHVLRIRDLDSGMVLTSVLEESVLFNTVQLERVDRSRLGPELQWTMLDGRNGISTSNFQLYEGPSGVAITLNNFAKLQEMGPDDRDDILSCWEFLVVDAWAARDLLRGLLD